MMGSEIRYESEAALCHWFGFGTVTVTKWRRALGMWRLSMRGHASSSRFGSPQSFPTIQTHSLPRRSTSLSLTDWTRNRDVSDYSVLQIASRAGAVSGIICIAT
jgi:hypothetical protein